jgi:hypothetical protein
MTDFNSMLLKASSLPAFALNSCHDTEKKEATLPSRKVMLLDLY